MNNPISPILPMLLALLLAAAGCERAQTDEECAEPAAAAVKEIPSAAAAPAAAAPATAAPATAAPGAPAGPAASAVKLAGTVYGAGVTVAETVAIADIQADPDKWVGKRVRVEGMVTDVCAKRGCWFNMAGERPGEQMRFKVKDGVMVFPMSARGQYAVAEGLVRKIPLDLEQTRRVMAHEAEEQGNEFDPATVTEPITLVRLDGAGAVLRDKK